MGGGGVEISHHMTGLKMDHLGLVETGRHCSSLQEYDRIPQQFRRHVMIHQLDSTVSYNKHDLLSGYYQYRVTASLSTRNLSGRKIGSSGDATGLGRWSWQRSRGQGNTTLRISTFYRTVPPNQGLGTGSLYAQHLTFFNNTGIRDCPRLSFLLDFLEAISTWSKEGDQIIVTGDLHKHINI